MILVYSTDDLLHIIPGQVNGPQQARDLLSRVSGYISAAEEWVFSNIVSKNLLKDSSAELLDSIRRVVLLRALSDAIPALDLVLTPNGFGVVSTDSIAPASKERVAALVVSLNSSFTNQLILLLKSLAESEVWRTSPIGMWWMATCLQPSAFDSQNGDGFSAFSKIRQELIKTEEVVSSRLLGQKLLDKIRLFSFTGKSADGTIPNYLFMFVAQQVVAYIMQLDNSHGKCCTLPNFLNVIHANPEAFPEWHESEIAALFKSRRFENVKDSPAFFF